MKNQEQHVILVPLGLGSKFEESWHYKPFMASLDGECVNLHKTHTTSTKKRSYSVRANYMAFRKSHFYRDITMVEIDERGYAKTLKLLRGASNLKDGFVIHCEKNNLNLIEVE